MNHPDEDRIPAALHEALVLDAMPLAAVTLAAGLLAVVGAFLVLRRKAMLGDATAHAVLPGLVAAFLLTGSRSAGPMVLGALLAGLLAAGAIHVITRFGRVEPSAAIGIVYTSLFALGVLLVEQAGSRNVDLDVDCVLSGQLELLFWNAPETWDALLSIETLRTIPGQVLLLAGLLVLLVAFVGPGLPLLRAATFDPRFAATRGLFPTLLSGALMAFTTAIIVASFDVLGSILVVALLVCPAATARLGARSLRGYLIESALRGAGAGFCGYALATRVAPPILGYSLDASGMVAVVAGGMLALRALRASRDSRSARTPGANESPITPLT